MCKKFKEKLIRCLNKYNINIFIAQDLIQEKQKWQKLKADWMELDNFAADATDNEEDGQLVKIQLLDLKKQLVFFEERLLFQSKYDQFNALIFLHSGAGGVDAQDWTEMLLRMYLRYAEKKGWQVKILEKVTGAEAGIKKATLELEGENAYGYLKNEKGVHRLVRLSPFNANNLRQTSFALVEVLPLMEEADAVKIESKDLKIDTFRSSGAGGQSVNTTDSAVRITHLPTNLVVTCQNERSQLQNKQKALEILKSRLAQRMEEERVDKIEKLKQKQDKIEWGSQIRSYVLHPYKMVKDHRTGFQSSMVSEILDGELDEVIKIVPRYNNN